MAPPSAPRHLDGHGIDNQGKGLGDPPGPPQPGRRHGGPGDPGAQQEARLTPGSQPPTCEEDKLASPGWKLPEDLGTKGSRDGKVVSLYPPSLEKLGDRTYPPSEEYMDERRPRRLLRRTRRGFPPKPLRPQGCTCGIPLAYKRRTEAPKGKRTHTHKLEARLGSAQVQE